MSRYAVRRLSRALVSAVGLWVALALCAAVTAGCGTSPCAGGSAAWLGRIAPWQVFAGGTWSAVDAAILPTALLAGSAALIALPAGCGLGLLLGIAGSAFRRRGTAHHPARRIPSMLGHGASSALEVCQGLPTFWLGGLLVAAFSVGLGWLPPGGIVSFALPPFGDPAYTAAVQAHPGAVLGDLLSHLALPALTLALAGLATPLRLLRTSIPLELGAPHAQAGRAAGLRRSRLLWRAVRPTVPLVAGAIAADLPILASALVLVEYLFGWPGLGLLAYHAARSGDWALLQALVFLGGLAAIVAGAAADLLAAWADPQLRGVADAR